TLARLKRYGEAREIFQRYIAESPHPSQWTLEALYWLARIALRLGEEDLLLDISKRLATHFPGTNQRAQVLIWSGRLYEDKKQPEQAVEAYRQVLAEFRVNPLVDEALWGIGWIAYRSGRYEEAIQTFSTYITSRPQGDSLPQFLYWKGRSEEKLDRFLRAVAVYKEVCRAYQGYYCHMAERRLARPGSNGVEQPSTHAPLPQPVPATPIPSPKDIPDRLSSDPHYQSATELLLLGFDAEAKEELHLLSKRYANDEVVMLELARLLYQTADYSRTLSILRTYFPDRLKRGDDGVSSGIREMAFPLPVVELIKRQVVSGLVNPYLVAAVMREESAFNPRVVSRAGAVGLMQIMPATGQWVAQRLGHRSFHPDRLFNPEVSIQLGSWYLGHLAREFNGNLILTIAGYNAGPEVVAQWVKTLPREVDEFIESIPFSETRSYTKRVIHSYIEYLRVAGLNPPQQLTLLAP
ncbi:MAG: transglycosylase SLT domain-containing protein, partial [Deltaproteobacteria bacterium]|nr:transglycosylase SLT domain-containing protein [Deltaproteobacteria bacterium]